MKKGSKYILISIIVVVLILAIILAIYKANLTGRVVQQTSVSYYNITWNLTDIILANKSGNTKPWPDGLMMTESDCNKASLNSIRYSVWNGTYCFYYYSADGGLSSGSPSETRSSGVVVGEWTKDLEAAKAYAKANNKVVLIDFSKWAGCAYCNNLHTGVLSRSIFREWLELNNIPTVFSDMSDSYKGNQSSEPGRTVKATYGEYYSSQKNILRGSNKPISCTQSYPTIIIIDGDGKFIDCFVARAQMIYFNTKFTGNVPSFIEITKLFVENYASGLPAQNLTNNTNIPIAQDVYTVEAEETSPITNQPDPEECADGSCEEGFDGITVDTQTYQPDPQSTQLQYSSCLDNCNKNKLSVLGCGNGIIGRIKCFRKSCETFCKN